MKPSGLWFGMSIIVATSAATPCLGADDLDRTLSPYFIVEGGDPEVDRLPLKETTATVHISGVIADVVVTQVYANDGLRPIHARYLFPASTRAAVHGMTLQVGNRRIRAQIHEKEAAQHQFAAARAAGKTAALLEEHRPNVFSMNVANVMPLDEIRVELHYSELLVPTDGVYELVYPTVVGPRYTGAPLTSADEEHRSLQSCYLPSGQLPSYHFGLDVHLAAGMPIQEVDSSSHDMRIAWHDPDTVSLTLDPSEAEGGNRDFILRYRLQGDQVQSGLLLHPGEDESFFLLMVQPPRRVATAHIPPRDYIFVLDVSGSMEGFPLDTARELMHELVSGLRPSDRFNVILFAGSSYLLSPESLPATAENLEYAMTAIDNQGAGGCSELGAALDRALSLPLDHRVSRSTIVITDGFISAEAEVFELIRNNLHQSNVFAFGIGSSVNRFLIEGIAKAGLGEAFVVTHSGEAQREASRFRAYVSSPVLTDVEIESEGFDIYSVEPPSLPDLFADRPIVLFGKWRGAPTGTLTLRGAGGRGFYQQSFDVADALRAVDESDQDDNRGLEYLWARARVARLSDYGSTHDDEVKEEVTLLGLTYDLLTPYTSFIAVHEVVRNRDSDTPTVEQPLPLPEGVENESVAVPEPELWMVLVLLLLAATVSSLRPRLARR